MLRLLKPLAARLLAKEGARQRRVRNKAAIRAQVDRMRADMGKPPVNWSAL